MADLKPLPRGTNPLGIPATPSSVCPADAPVKNFNVVSLDRPLKLHPKAPDTIEVDFERKIEMTVPEGKIFALEEEATTVAGNVMPNPLTLRANLGDCIKVNLKNKMKASRASFFAPGLAFDPRDSQGLNVGNNPGDQTIAPGESRTYTYYAHPANKETTSLVWDGGNIVVNPRNGLYGAVIIGPKGSQYRDPVTGADISQKNSWRADVIVDASLPENVGKRNYRDVALFFQDEDNIIGTAFMPYVQNVAGLTSVNYRAEPYKFREEQGCSLGKIFQPCVVDKPEDPVTPLIEAHAGDAIRIHVIGANSEQNGMFGVEGHEWPIEPYMPGADMISVVEYAGSEILDVFIRGGAGGPYRQVGDFEDLGPAYSAHADHIGRVRLDRPFMAFDPEDVCCSLFAPITWMRIASPAWASIRGVTGYLSLSTTQGWKILPSEQPSLAELIRFRAEVDRRRPSYVLHVGHERSPDDIVLILEEEGHVPVTSASQHSAASWHRQ